MLTFDFYLYIIKAITSVKVCHEIKNGVGDSMKMTPIKKIILAIAAVAVVISIITANNVASMMLFISANRSNNTVQQTANNGTNTNVNANVAENNNGAVVDNGTSTGNTVADNNTSGSSDTAANNTGNTSTNNTSGNNTNTNTNTNTNGNSSSNKTPSSSESSDAAIVKTYQDAMNKAKSSAKSVILVSSGATNYNGIFEAGALSDVGQGLVDKFMGISEKNEEVGKGKLPPDGKTVNIDISKVKSAKQSKSGDNTVIVITMKDYNNPVAGDGGIGSVINPIEESVITGSISSVPGLSLSNIVLQYENVRVTATLDKNGNLIKYEVDAPSVLCLSAKLGFISIDNAKVGIEVQDVYKISY